MRVFLFLLTVVAGVLVVVRMATGQAPAHPGIGEAFTVFAGPGTQRGPTVAFDEGARRHLIVWADATAGDIYGRVIDDQGAPVGSQFPISVASGTQITPTLAAGALGQGFFVVWQDARSEDWDIYGQRVSPTGRLLNAEGTAGADPAVNEPLVTGPGNQHMPDVAYSPLSDHYLLAWVDVEPEDEGGSVGIKALRISATGVPVGDPVTVVEQRGTVAHPAVAYNPAAGEFLVVWQRQDVWVENRRLSDAGELQGLRRQIWGSTVQPYPAPVPDVVYNPSTGEYLVVWDDASDDNVYGIRVLSDGQPDGERIVVSSAPGLQVQSQVGTHGAGYLVTWADSRDPDSADVYGQLLSQSGGRVNPEGTPEVPADANVPLSTAIPDQQGPALAFNPGGIEYLLTWAEGRPEDSDILGERIWFPAMGPRPTPTPTRTPTPTVTPTPTNTPTATPTPTPTLPPQYLVPVFRNWPRE